MAVPWSTAGSSTDLSGVFANHADRAGLTRPWHHTSIVLALVAATTFLLSPQSALAQGTLSGGSAGAPSIERSRGRGPSGGGTATETPGGGPAPAYSPPTGSTRSTPSAEFKLTFNLGQQGRSGCLVCHSDKNLTRMSAGRQRSFYVNEAVVDASAHRNVSCLGCHLDFNFSAPHGKTAGTFRRVAGTSCRNCHARVWDLYEQSAHGAALRKDPNTPLCSDCHGSHDIGFLTKDPRERAKLHKRGYQVCGRCHLKYWNNYKDYYHGAAYGRGAPDSPACWQCHRAHDIYPSKDPKSATNKASLALTCGSCHEGVRSTFLNYTQLVHYGGDVRKRNVVLRYYDEVRIRIAGALGAVARAFRSVFG